MGQLIVLTEITGSNDAQRLVVYQFFLLLFTTLISYLMLLVISSSEGIGTSCSVRAVRTITPSAHNA